MKDGPCIAPIAALAGDPARANMLAALMSGAALTASELAAEAGVTAPTASAHLAKLKAGGMIAVLKQGRHRYFRLADEGVAAMLESMMEVAARAGHLRARPGPRDPALRRARICYDHLAGEFGVRMFDSLVAARYLVHRRDGMTLTRSGEEFLAAFGIDVAAFEAARRPVCKACLDWSMRRHHLAGAAGAALLARMREMKWLRRERDSRALLFTPDGQAKFRRQFPA
ncbi:MAG: winged helix-turn-helix transcriptional regulator [Alphaproteobacteria bacterium]|nr:winged helix-turn-helix transcriptional regulator [Alphaproteobacteria bacterium]MBV9693595.1 winged helix-turn-helix transcriptional regulator [Alphaproteobacteria bacterium]